MQQKLLQKIFKIQASTYFAFLKIITLTAQELLTATATTFFKYWPQYTDTAHNQNFKRLPISHLSTSRNLVVFLKTKEQTQLGSMSIKKPKFNEIKLNSRIYQQQNMSLINSNKRKADICE